MGRLTGDLKERTLRFAAVVLTAVKGLPNEPRAWVLVKQLTRSASSIGANVWEADTAQTDSELAHIVNIARKEAGETAFWLELTRRLEMALDPPPAELAREADEIQRVLSRIVRKTQEHIRETRR
jgi:four helix bundle protein